MRSQSSGYDMYRLRKRGSTFYTHSPLPDALSGGRKPRRLLKLYGAIPMQPHAPLKVDLYAYTIRADAAFDFYSALRSAGIPFTMLG